MTLFVNGAPSAEPEFLDSSSDLTEVSAESDYQASTDDRADLFAPEN